MVGGGKNTNTRGAVHNAEENSEKSSGISFISDEQHGDSTLSHSRVSIR